MNAAPFPVICLSSDGRVAAKNRAAYTYLPKIRMKSSLSRKASFSECGNAKLQDADSPFKYAVCVPLNVNGETVRICLFLPSAQSGEFYENAKTPDAARLLEIIKRERESIEPRRIYSEMAEAFSAFDRENVDGSPTDVAKTAEILDKLFSSGFRALGCRATVRCSDAVKAERFFKLNFFAFVYSVMTAAYVAMRLSDRGTAEVTVDCGDTDGYLSVTSSSRTNAQMPKSVSCAEDAVASLVPEYAIEMTADRELSTCRAPKKCSIKDGLFKLSIPVRADTRPTPLRSRRSFYTLDDIVGAIFGEFAESTRKTMPRRKTAPPIE